MRTSFSPKKNPRVIIIQKLYGRYFNEDEEIIFPKHRFKKFIKDIVSGTLERDEIIIGELDKSFGMERLEYHCAKCGVHHGHVFNDGPKESGKRFCNNGLCLIFKPE